MLSYTEENYLKTIYHLSQEGNNAVSTSEIAEAMNTKAASVTDMIKKLSNKELIAYEKYYGVKITKQGKTQALLIVRKHRLWETFLVNKLGFLWHEVHDVAEQLEHIHSALLIEKLDEFLGYPSVDPHGHPIPDKNGKIKDIRQNLLVNVAPKKELKICAVKNGTTSFLQHLSKIGAHIGAAITVVEKISFDGSLKVLINKKEQFISREAAEKILVTE